MIRDTVRGDGSELKLLRGPLTLDGEPTGVHRPPPGFGEHGVEVLRELGLAESVVTQLIADAVLVGVPATPGAQ